MGGDNQAGLAWCRELLESFAVPSRLSLSHDDVAKLLSEPSPENRAATAEKVGEFYADGEPSEAEKAIAQDIFRAMVRDAEVRVREALAQTLKESPDLPSDVARTLAADVDSVALPVIEYSQVLTDEDLIEIAASQKPERQMAVARRNRVSADVADVLAESDNEQVVSTLVANDGAEIREPTYDRLLDKFADSDVVKEPMVKRSHLPLSVAERLVNLVSDNLREHLVAHHDLSSAVASDLLLESRERATVTLLTPGAQAPDVLKLVEQLHAGGRLTPTLIIRALCMGDLIFFEAALAKRAGIPAANAYTLVHDRGEMGLARLFEKADMPSALLKIARIGVTTAEELRLTSGDDRETFRKVMIERVLTQVDEEIDADNLDYLVGKLGKKKRAA